MEFEESGILSADTATTTAFFDAYVAPTALDDNSNIDMTVSSSLQPAWLEGMQPVSRPGNSAGDQGLVILIIALLMGLCMSFKTVCRLWGELHRRLFASDRFRTAEHTTAAEKRTLFLLLLMAIVFVTVPATAAMSLAFPDTFTASATNSVYVGLLFSLYILFQYAAYNVVGRTFASDESCTLWVQGFTSSTVFMGVFLALPALIILFYPVLSLPMVIASCAIYIIARIIFIFRGFRIFYTNYSSLVYFILYLCTLEIIPVFLLIHFARILCKS